MARNQGMGECQISLKSIFIDIIFICDMSTFYLSRRFSKYLIQPLIV